MRKSRWLLVSGGLTFGFALRGALSNLGNLAVFITASLFLITMIIFLFMPETEREVTITTLPKKPTILLPLDTTDEQVAEIVRVLSRPENHEVV
jgi:hypothetical protein